MAIMVPPLREDVPVADRPPLRRSRRRWRAKFREAGRGVKLGIRGHSSFFVHFFCAALVAAAATALQCDVLEWAVLLGCVGGVLAAELFNSALETLFHGLDAATKQRLVGVLDIAAGAVLVASVTAAVVGAIVLGHRLWAVLS
jgi:diacylglycerol kinase